MFRQSPSAHLDEGQIQTLGSRNFRMYCLLEGGPPLRACSNCSIENRKAGKKISYVMRLIADAPGNRSVFLVHQQVPTKIVSLDDVASVDQVTFLDRPVLQVHLPTKSLHLREESAMSVRIRPHIVKGVGNICVGGSEER